MLMLSRRIDEARSAFQQGIIGEPVGRMLAGKTLGIVGMGRVGTCLASAAKGLGMQVREQRQLTPSNTRHSICSKTCIYRLYLCLSTPSLPMCAFICADVYICAHLCL